MAWSSKAMYQNKLVAHEDVKDRIIKDLMSKESIDPGAELLTEPLAIIDTAGSLMHEAMEDRIPKMGGISESKHNNGEADLVITVV